MKKNGVVNKLLSLVFVPRCLECAEPLESSGEILCSVCKTRYELLCHRKCRYCGHDICTCDCTKDEMTEYGVWRLSKLCAYIPSEKHSPFKAMLYNLKSKNNSDVREFFASELADMIKRKCPDYSEYTLCFVPRSFASYKKYGYDHMRQTCTLVSEKLGIGCEVLFEREKDSKVQKQLDRKSRFKNAEKSITRKTNSRSVRDGRFILIDDVCVSGASLGRCASLLIADGAREVRCFVIASRP